MLQKLILWRVFFSGVGSRVLSYVLSVRCGRGGCWEQIVELCTLYREILCIQFSFFVGHGKLCTVPQNNLLKSSFNLFSFKKNKKIKCLKLTQHAEDIWRTSRRHRVIMFKVLNRFIHRLRAPAQLCSIAQYNFPC